MSKPRLPRSLSALPGLLALASLLAGCTVAVATIDAAGTVAGAGIRATGAVVGAAVDVAVPDGRDEDKPESERLR